MIAIERQEWAWVWKWTLVALIASSIPYLLGSALSLPEMQFSGLVYNVQDINGYLAKMRQGARGEWLFHTPYTAEEHTGTLFFLFHRLLGMLAAMTGLSLELIYHLARLVFAAGMLAAMYRFFAGFTPHRAIRRVAFLLAAFSGGMGWLLVLLGQADWLGMLPLDWILPEGYAFLVTYSVPHIALAMTCLLCGILVLRAACSRRSAALALAAGALFAVMALMAAFYVLTPYALLGVDWLITAARRRRPDWPAFWLIAFSALLPALVIGYNFYYFTFDPFYRVWATQNLALSPHPAHYLMGYLVIGGLALWGVWTMSPAQRTRWQLLWVWALLAPALAYLPFGLQRRLIFGVQNPLCLLAAAGLVRGVALPFGRMRIVKRLLRRPRYSRSGLRRLLIATVVISTTITNLLLITGNCITVLQRTTPIFHPRAELEMLDWLRTHSQPTDTVLCAYQTGNYAPVRAGNRVFLGIGSETLDIERKRVDVQRFFNLAESDKWRQSLLREYGIAYVVIGPDERALGRFDPATTTYLSRVYANDRYTVYQVAQR